MEKEMTVRLRAHDASTLAEPLQDSTPLPRPTANVASNTNLAYSPLAQLLRYLTHAQAGLPYTETESHGDAQLRNLASRRAFNQGHRASLDHVFTPVILTSLALDVFHYVNQVDARSGHHWWDLIAPHAASDTLLGASMVESLPLHGELWHPLLLLVGPIMIGGVQALRYRHYTSPMTEMSDTYALTDRWLTAAHQNPGVRARLAFCHQLADIELALCFDTRLTDEMSNALLESMITIAQTSRGTDGLLAQISLYRVLIYQLRTRQTSYGDYDSVTDKQIACIQMALQTCRQQGGITGLMANYLLWLRQDGHHRAAWAHLLTVFTQLYGRLRYWLTLAIGLKIAIEHINTAVGCNTATHFYYEVNQFLCGLCADISDVPFWDRDDPNACLQASLAHYATDSTVLSTVMQRVAETIPSNTSIALDLSQQSMASWPRPNWQAWLTALTALATRARFPDLDLARQTVGEVAGDRLLAMAPMAREQLILDGQVFTNDEWSSLALDPTLRRWSLADTQLSTAQVVQLAGHLNTTQALTHLNVSGIALDVTASEALGHALAALPQLQHVNLRACEFSTESFTALMQALRDSRLTELCLDDVDLSECDLSDLHSVVNNGLQHLSCIGTVFDDEGAAQLATVITAGRALVKFGFSTINLSQIGVQPLMNALGASNVTDLAIDLSASSSEVRNSVLQGLGFGLTRLQLREAELDESEFDGLLQQAPHWRLAAIDLSGTSLHAVNMTDFLQAITHHGPDAFQLRLQHCAINDAQFIRLASTLPRLGSITWSLDLSYNALSAASHAALPHLQHVVLTDLTLAENALGDAICATLQVWLADPSSHLHRLDLHGARLGPDCITQFSPSDWTGLRTLDLHDNPLGDSGTIRLMQDMVDIDGVTQLASGSSGDWRRYFYAKARSTVSSLRELRLEDTAMTAVGHAAACRVVGLYKQHGHELTLAMQQTEQLSDGSQASAAWSTACSTSAAASNGPNPLLFGLVFLLAVSQLGPWVFHWLNSVNHQTNTTHHQPPVRPHLGRGL